MLLAEIIPGASKLAVMNGIVDTYNAWGGVERTLLTDMDRLLAQFPRLVAVAVYPQFTPEAVFDAAAEGFQIGDRALRGGHHAHRHGRRWAALGVGRLAAGGQKGEGQEGGKGQKPGGVRGKNGHGGCS